MTDKLAIAPPTPALHIPVKRIIGERHIAPWSLAFAEGNDGKWYVIGNDNSGVDNPFRAWWSRWNERKAARVWRLDDAGMLDWIARYVKVN